MFKDPEVFNKSILIITKGGIFTKNKLRKLTEEKGYELFKDFYNTKRVFVLSKGLKIESERE